MPINTLSRVIVNAGLQGLRLPLSAVERLTAHTGDPTWGPTIVFESFSAEARTTLGSVLRDPDLVRDGHAQRARVEELTDAARLRAAADRKRAEAGDRARKRTTAAEQARDRVDHRADERERKLARDKAAKERRVREQARRQKEAVDKTAEVRDEVVTGEEQVARAVAVAEEAEALAQRQAALDATRDAQVLDDEIEAKKAQRAAVRDAAADW